MYFTCGCTYPTACNYDPNALCDDGSCIGTGTAGCTDPLACNYDPQCKCDDGSCILPDANADPLYIEYDATALCDDGSCLTLIVNGCMDATACNYNSGATVDDGSCDLPNGCGDALYLEYDACYLVQMHQLV